MNSEMIGNPTTMPWAFIFKTIDNVPRHPAQLYEALSYLLIFASIFYYLQINSIKIGNGFI
jgi:prolipoprotein diacylglyceryltransferase